MSDRWVECRISINQWQRTQGFELAHETYDVSLHVDFRGKPRLAGYNEPKRTLLGPPKS